MDIPAIAIVCIAATVIAKVIQPSSRDLAALLSISAVVVVFLSISSQVYELVSAIKRTADSSGIDSGYIAIALKALGICYICELAGSSCRDCGESALASVVDISGRIAIAIICLPLIESFINVVKSILEM